MLKHTLQVMFIQINHDIHILYSFHYFTIKQLEFDFDECLHLNQL